MLFCYWQAGSVLQVFPGKEDCFNFSAGDDGSCRSLTNNTTPGDDGDGDIDDVDDDDDGYVLVVMVTVQQVIVVMIMLVIIIMMVFMVKVEQVMLVMIVVVVIVMDDIHGESAGGDSGDGNHYNDDSHGDILAGDSGAVQWWANHALRPLSWLSIGMFSLHCIFILHSILQMPQVLF